MPEKFACDNLGHDAEGNYCIIKQLEGHNCGCPYEDAEIDWVKQHGVRRPQLKDHAGAGDGVCMDYEP